MKKTFSLTVLIIGAVIGAGFASGKEICTFFVRFGPAAYGLALLSGCVLFVGTLAVLKVADRLPERNADAFHRALFGRAAGLGTLFALGNAFLLTASMLGAFDVLMPYGGIVGSALCFFALLGGAKGVDRVNAVAVPLILLLTGIVSLYSLWRGGTELVAPFSATGGKLSAILYAGMNLLTLGVALCETPTTGRERLSASAISAGIVTAMICLQIATVSSAGASAYYAAMPLLEIAESVRLGAVARIVMGLGIFTTLAVCVHTEARWLEGLVGSRWIALLGSLTIGLAISQLGFDRIVSVLYPVLGVLGLVVTGACGVCLARRERTAIRARFAALLHGRGKRRQRSR